MKWGDRPYRLHLVTQIQISAVIWFYHQFTYTTYVQSTFNVIASNCQSFPKGVSFLCIINSATSHSLMFFNRLKTSHPLWTKHNTNHMVAKPHLASNWSSGNNKESFETFYCRVTLLAWRTFTEALLSEHPTVPTPIPTLIFCTHITKIKEWLCSLRLADMPQNWKSVVRVRDYYVRNTANFTNLDTLPSWKMCLIIWESILPGILSRHWVHHVWRVMVKVSHDMPVQAQKGGTGIAPTQLLDVGGQHPWDKKTTTHFYRRLWGQSGGHRKSYPTGIQSPDHQPIANH